ncbi:hypothetical protein E1B28_006496 [Marasmius oreades]|uniref:Asl1-like glycosyl hydrolase catalytic domain-containing protein n=1 Tax=Marasmius oreades TaxID=181124 RepID=A0A9P7S7M8_9AGAR|nr:uncharacterized protein E1B28_006496 [Marasmius oreades]KAG7095796.1 hypothetical protein E1B28_006496 [Marasmius oreades]
MTVPASVRLGGPAVSARPTGQQWLKDFFAACNGGCRVDFLPIHWYGEGTANFDQYVQVMHNMFNKPIWVTEFAPTSGDALAFMRDTLTFLDSIPMSNDMPGLLMLQLPQLVRSTYPPVLIQNLNHSLFVGLLDGNNNINNLGNIYINGA